MISVKQSYTICTYREGVVLVKFQLFFYNYDIFRYMYNYISTAEEKRK